MSSRDRDGNDTHICGSAMGAGLSFTGVGRARDSCLRERAGITE